jgi:glycosyltransferase involved in cell wall biosynthesis
MGGVLYDISEGRGPQLRGWGRYVRQLAEALGDAVVPVAGRLAPGIPELAWEQVGLPRVLRRRRAALVHAPNCFLPLDRPCPGVVTIHDLAFEAFPDDFAPLTRWKYRTFASLAARSAERVIVPSSFTAGDVVARYGVARERIRVIPEAPALPTDPRTSLTPPPAGVSATFGGPEGDYLLAVGDVRAKKNLGVARGAAARLGLPLVEVGVGGSLGYVDDARLDALMRGAAALVHPSLYEGFGLVVLEAMARGTPVACADATALPETAGGAAELFDPRSEASAADAIARALDRRDELAERGRARAAEFSWERTAAMTRAVYEELL